MVQPELSAFGAAVRRYRTRLGISQEELAERSALHRTYLSGVERGERNLGLVNVYRIAKALKVPTAELFEAAEGLRRGRSSRRPR
jgi:transcriptional regulator with XRE-family HTH domain